MKKKYIAPDNLVIHINSHTLMNNMSWEKFDVGADDDVILTREYGSVISNRSVWDEEW